MLFSSIINKLEYKILAGDPESCEVLSICRDSRMIADRGLFVCVKGAVNDGHRYAQMAYENGCRAFIVERPVELPDDASVVLVDDSRIALASASAAFYREPSSELHVIGITGTKGKTTTALTSFEVLNG